MGFDINQVILVGRAGKDAEINKTSSGKDIVTFSMATNTYLGKDSQGNAKQDTEWSDIKCFGYAARSAKEVQKGDRVMVHGRKKTESWDDRDGGKKYRTMIYADSVEIIFVPKKQNDTSGY